MLGLEYDLGKREMMEGVDPEYLMQQPVWIQESRAPSEEEYTTWSREQEGGCPEYAAMFPLTHYNGACSFYIMCKRQKCGVPFVSKMTCRTGQVDEGKGPRRGGWRKQEGDVRAVGRPQGLEHLLSEVSSVESLGFLLDEIVEYE